MSNRQTFPQSLYPLEGDIASETGSPDVTVTGIQHTPFAPDTPLAGQIPVMNSDGSWHPEDPVVSGTDPVGSPSTENPVQVAGVDEGNLVRELRTDTNGSLRVLRLEELMEQVLLELRAIKTAIIESNNLSDKDYAPENFVTR
jgi:hypothetical protein